MAVWNTIMNTYRIIKVFQALLSYTENNNSGKILCEHNFKIKKYIYLEFPVSVLQYNVYFKMNNSK